MLDRYKQEFSLRPELSKYIDKVCFHTDENSILSHVSTLVCARNPQSQVKLLETACPFNGHLFLEKPLAPTIAQHASILKKLSTAKQKFSIGYLFPYTSWYREILDKSKSGGTGTYDIQWEVKLSDTSWKSKLLTGGGIVSYYAIHFVTLLDNLETDFSSIKFLNQKNRLMITCIADERIKINIAIKISSSNHFRVYCTSQEGFSQELINTETPFGLTGVRGVQDPRVPFLVKYLAHYHKVSDSKLNLELELKAHQFRGLLLQ
jgi:hypothetical protein